MQESDGEKRVQAWRAAANEVAQRGEAPPHVIKLMHGMLADLAVQTRLTEVNAALSARHFDRANQLEIKTGTDFLTGMPNREGLDRIFSEKVADSARHPERPANAFVLVDADGFKKINDTYGHDVGDGMIRHIAAILKPPAPGEKTEHHLLRAVDRVARLGGDEFVIILSEVGAENAQKVIPALQQRIQEERPFVFVDTKGKETVEIPVRLSMGIATFAEPPKGVSLGDYQASVYKAADEALYANKKQRRQAPAAPKPETPKPVLAGLKRKVRGALMSLAKKL